jgi:methylthioribose-1-phosphate isomerase
LRDRLRGCRTANSLAFLISCRKPVDRCRILARGRARGTQTNNPGWLLLAVHVWVDETRPRNQGAALTAWELKSHGVPHTVIADNVGGHLMQHGQVDLCLVGTDRTTASGDVANKIGTYLKALAAHDNGVPFYVALPSPSIDWTLADGVSGIPIEQRPPEELSHVSGLTKAGDIVSVRVVPEGSPIANYAFDVTPARLVTGLITERGVASASRHGLAALYPEKAAPKPGGS